MFLSIRKFTIFAVSRVLIYSEKHEHRLFCDLVKSETNQNQFVIYGVNNPKIIDWNSQSMASDDNENKQKHKTTKPKQRQGEREGERETDDRSWV